MRQQQNNNKNRMRGRGRKPSGNTNRNFESNGPDVKIRGNAAHVAEKYTTLARDALSSGDRVIAENYLQHAEHYNRIVLANNAAREEAQAAQAKNQPADRDNDQQPDMQAGEDATDTASEQADERNNRRPRRRDANGSERGDAQRDNRSRNSRTSRDDDSGSEASSGESVEAVNAGKANEDTGEEKPKPRTKRTTRKKADTPENISTDAAGLPQGLLSGAGSRETAAAED